MRTGNTYRNVWTVGPAAHGDPASGVAVFEHHEYMVFRYAALEPATPYVHTATCVEVDEAADAATAARASVHCSNSPSSAEVIDRVVFASYGTPRGRCDTAGGAGNLSVDTSCHAPSSASVAAKACVGRNGCTIDVSNAGFEPPAT